MSIVKVECHGCHAQYQVEERRIPPTGLKMKCSKCGTSLLVTKSGDQAEADLPAAAAPKKPGAPPRPVAKPAAPPPPRTTKEWGVIEADITEAEPELPVARAATRPGPPPVPVRAAVPAAPAAQPPPPPTGRKTAGFGEIDLMVDLPSPASFGSTDDPGAHFTADDLPSVPAARGSSPASSGFGEIEGFGDVDLPIVQPGGAPDLPTATRPRKESGLPAALGRAKSGGEFGEIDLPIVGGGEADLPFAHHELPSPFDNSPVKAREHGFGGGGFGEIDFPLASQGDALPMPTGGSALPSPAQGAGLPQPAFGAALPVPAQGGALPSVAGPGMPQVAMSVGVPAVASAHDVLPTATTEQSLPIYGGEAEIGFGALGPNPYDDSDRTDRAASALGGAPIGAAGIDLDAAPPAEVGDEADLAAAPPAMESAALRMRPAPEPVSVAPPKRSNKGKIALVALVLVALGGGSLALVPAIGPFGINFLGDKVNAGKQTAALEQARAAVQTALGEDTFGAATRALSVAKQAHESAPRHASTMAYAAYAAAAHSLRFGKRGDDEAYARQMLAAAGPEPDKDKALASAAMALITGDVPRAKDMASSLATNSPNDEDTVALVGEIELAQNSKGAVQAWKRAVAVKPTARALFGLARAALAAGDDAAAKDAAQKAVTASPLHAGARVLLGSLAWKGGDEEGALALLKKVTDDATVRGNACDAEVIQAFTWLGRIHLAKSRASAAEKAFGEALKLDPQAIDALTGQAELFFRAGRYSEALARFETTTRADPENVLAKVGVARAYLALERMKEAKDLLKKERDKHPKDALVAVWLGRAEEALGNRKEAEAAFRAAIAGTGAPTDVVDAYVALAHLLSGNGRNDDATQKLAEASEKFPDSSALHRAKGDVALQAGQYEEAKKELEAALEKEDEIGTRFKLGITSRRLKEFDAAGKLLDQVAAADKDYPGLALERGLLFAEMGQSDKALEMYDAALKKAPNDPDLKLRVGSTQVISGHPDQAEKILREVIRERPSSAEVNHFLGRAILLRGGNAVEAQRFLQKATDLDPNRAEYQLYVGWVANEVGNAGLAEGALNKALELDHDLGDAYWQKGILLQKQGQTIDAITALETALAKRSSRFEAYATLALCFEDQQKWADAEQAWRKAIAGNDAVPEWHYRLGRLLTQHGNRAAAVPEEIKATQSDDGSKAPPGWMYDAHFILAEGVAASDRAKAIEHYKRFLELAPADNAYRPDATKALTRLGGSK